jgi:chromosome segregation ATPase
MSNENETLRPSQADAIRSEIAEMRQYVEAATSDIRRTRTDIEQCQDAHESHVRRTWVLWAMVVLVIIGLAAFSWYGSPLLAEHKGLLDKMPLLQTTFNDINTRVMDTEHRIGEWANERDGLTDRMSKIEQSVSSNMKTVRNEVRLMGQQIKDETTQTVQALQNRVSGVESTQREHSEEVARLKNELAGVRQELAGVREENERQASQISSQSEQISQINQSTRNVLSGLERRLSSNQTAVTALGYQVDRKRIDFELPSGRTQQIADGIYLTIKNTDVERQRVDGWVQIASEGRFVWLHGQGAQNPIDFSSRTDARPDQLVITQVGRDTASGYILVPVTGAASATGN